MSYIICGKRKGSPKVNVEVCRRKCIHAEQCKPYQDYLAVAQVLPPGKGNLGNQPLSP